jgi:predicted transcriptional regulator
MSNIIFDHILNNSASTSDFKKVIKDVNVSLSDVASVVALVGFKLQSAVSTKFIFSDYTVC